MSKRIGEESLDTNLTFGTVFFAESLLYSLGHRKGRFQKPATHFNLGSHGYTIAQDVFFLVL